MSEMRLCAHCAEPFCRPNTRGPNPKYCSHECGNAAFRQRRSPEQLRRVKENQRKYRMTHPKRIRKRAAAYRAANRERDRERARKVYAANREKYLKRGRAFRAANRERLRKRGREFYWKTRALILAAKHYLQMEKQLNG